MERHQFRDPRTKDYEQYRRLRLKLLYPHCLSLIDGTPGIGSTAGSVVLLNVLMIMFKSTICNIIRPLCFAVTVVEIHDVVLVSKWR